MKYLILILSVVLVGCSEPMSNEAVVEQTKYCESNGLRAMVLIDGFSWRVKNISCVPKN